MNDKITGYGLTRDWFDWAFENPELNTPNHTALYMWVIEKWNRLGQKQKFGLPTSEAMEAIGIKSYNTYKKVFLDLIEWGFIETIQLSKNQFTANIIALSNFDKALDKALDKAMSMHLTKQSESTVQSICSIDKPINQETSKPINQETNHYAESEILVLPVEEVFEVEKEKAPPVAELPPKKSKPLKQKVAEVAPKLVEHTFAEDELSNTYKFNLLFAESYPTLDADYYYFKISKWLDTKTGLPPKRKVWASVINQFITNDYQKGNLQLSKQQQHESKREQFQQLNSDTDEWLERRIARRNAKYGV